MLLPIDAEGSMPLVSAHVSTTAKLSEHSPACMLDVQLSSLAHTACHPAASNSQPDCAFVGSSVGTRMAHT